MDSQCDLMIDAKARRASDDTSCSQNIAILLTGSGKAINRRRGKRWHETCIPGNPPLIGMQAAAGGFLLGVAATLLGLYILTRLH